MSTCITSKDVLSEQMADETLVNSADEDSGIITVGSVDVLIESVGGC